MADLNDEVHSTIANLSKLSNEFDRYSRLTAGAADSSRELTTVQRAQAASSRSAADSLYSLRKASGSLGSSLYEGRRGMEAFTTATTATAEATGKLMKTLSEGLSVLGGNAVFSRVLSGLSAVSGATLKVAATLYDLASNMADRQYDAYSKLTDTGAIASEGMTGVGDAANKLGLNILKMDEYISLVNTNSKELALFGKSAFDGRRRFENLGQALEKDRESFFALGMTQDQVNESMMGYIKLQNLSGRSQKINDDELIAGTRKYLYEQDALAKLLGMSRKEQQSAREEAMSQQRFGAKLAAMKASGDAQQIKAAEEYLNEYTILKKVAPDLAAGFADLTTGMMQTEAAQKAYTTTQGQILRDIQDVGTGRKTGGEAGFSTLQATAKGAETFNMSYQMGGERFLLPFAETQAARLFLERDYNTEIKAILDDRGKLIAEGGKDKKEGGDKRLTDYAKLLKDQQQIMLTLQSVVNHGLEITFKGEKINLSASTVIKMQQEISDGIIKFLKNNEYFKLDVRDTGKSPANQIVSADTDLKNAKADAKVAKEAEARARKKLEDKATKVSIIEQEVKKGKMTQAQLDAEKQEAEKAATETKKAIEARETAEKQLAEAEKHYEEVKKNIKPVKAEPVEAKPVKAEPVEAKPVKAEPVEAKPVKAKPVEAKPAADVSAEENEEINKQIQAQKQERERASRKTAAPLTVDTLSLAEKMSKEQKQAINNVLRTMVLPNRVAKDKDGKDVEVPGLPDGIRPVFDPDNDLERGNDTWKDMVKNLSPAQKKGLVDDINKEVENILKKKAAEKTSAPATPNELRMNDAAALQPEQIAVNAKNIPTVADLTINSDVATLNSKGMNVTLDNSADVARMLTETVMSTKTDVVKNDQSIARTSFENSMSDVKTALSNQKDTNEMLLSAIQELIRVQKTGVDWQQKTYQATA